MVHTSTAFAKSSGTDFKKSGTDIILNRIVFTTSKSIITKFFYDNQIINSYKLNTRVIHVVYTRQP